MPVGHPVERGRRSRRTGALAAAILAATLALTGCTTLAKASTAAYVNGTAISDATVAQVSSEFTNGLILFGPNRGEWDGTTRYVTGDVVTYQGQTYGANQGDSGTTVNVGHAPTDTAWWSTPVKEADVLGVLILSPFVLNQVRSSGSWTPDARYNSTIQKIPNASQATKDFVATSIVLAQGGPLTEADVTAILDQLKKADVQLDPRFGTWDPTTGGFLATDDNWIKPTAAPRDGATTPAPTQEPAPSPTGASTGQ